ncbi:hypothetical protein [Streptomyces sp. YIM 132580]|uniref:hypothetical protein n=1 Tax=Streptomyces sp. YIM 132580 TaxID=2691958 RepID=UPI001370DB06|nr:hypothetical protein [Streptomyces sp. YIM 132580]MXG29527.1 hypothetical protein [Streptomyces sp. YIM 132580]
MTRLATASGRPELQDALRPAGAGLVIGPIEIAEGAVRHNTLGSWLALVSGAALFLGAVGVHAPESGTGGLELKSAGLLNDIRDALERMRVSRASRASRASRWHDSYLNGGHGTCLGQRGDHHGAPPPRPDPT